MEQKESKMRLPKITVDELFTTQEQRNDSSLEKVINIPIKDISDFPHHPFKVIINDEMNEMAESIKQYGVLSPALVRPKEDGGYEMIAGHRRKKASELARLDVIPCIVRDLSNEEATIIMVDSNLQREELLPSEKAFAYKMKIEALNKQGQRNDLTSSPVGTELKNSRATDSITEETGDSRNTIYRYIRLTELIPEILEMVDEKKIAFRPAVEISYLTEDEQYMLSYQMEYLDVTPSLAQAIQLKNMSKEGILTTEKLEALMEEEKPNQKEKVEIGREKLEKLLPPDVITKEQIQKFIFTCIEEHNQKQLQQKQRSHDAR